MSRDRPTGLALLVLGIPTIATGLYFLLLRPGMLPEDARFTGIGLEQAPEDLTAWLRIVFRTWGGFVTGFGIAIVGLALSYLTGRARLLRWGVAGGVLVAFGGFLASNLQLHSDFLWFIALLFAVAAAAAIRLVTSGKESSR